MVEMESTAGHLLVARPAMGDPNFDMSIVYMLEHNEDGALGVVVNRPTDTEVAEHLPDLTPMLSSPSVFFMGGPVSTEHIVGVGRVGGRIETIDLQGLIDGEVASPDGLRLFAGYSGWGPGQLEGELDADAWLTVDAFDGDVFGPRPASLWRDVLRRQGGATARLALFPDSPMFN
jgi:putative transcriptional regulator